MLSSIIISLVLSTLAIHVWKIVYWLWLGPKLLEKRLRKQGFRGNPYRFLHGDSKEIMSMMKENESKSLEISNHDILPHVLPYHHHYTKLHGKNYFVWMGTTPRLHIVDPKLVKNVFFQYTVFQKPKYNSVGKLLVGGLTVQEGDDWVRHRSILNPTFHLEKLKLMVPAMYASCSEMISKWEELLSKKDSYDVDVRPYLANLSADIISRTAFGSNYEEGKKIFQLQREQNGLIFQLLKSVFVPGWRLLPTKSNRRIKEIHREIETLMKAIINRRERAIKEGREKYSEDLLGTLVKTNLKEIEEQGSKKNSALSIEEIIDECRLFYRAGQDTTSLLLGWTMVLLSKHQIWQDRAREEIKAVFGDKEPEFDGLNRLKVLTMILYEVLRLYPPLSTVVRATHKKAKLGSFYLPAGVVISMPIIAIHTDPEIWGKDAIEFNPERFSEGVAKATDKQCVFLPLGAGPRICIGQTYALLQAKLVIAMILQRFSVQLSPSYIHAPSPTITMIRPQHGVHVVLNKVPKVL